MVTVITKTIGPTGRDYTTFTLAEAAVESIATAEFGSTDLVANDGAIVFEADAGTYDGLLFAWTLTTDATRNVTFKPATGSEHGGVFGAGVILQDNTAVTSYIALMLNSSTNHCVFDGLALNVRSGVNSQCSATRSGVGHIWRNCLFSSEGTQPLNISEDAFSCGSASDPIVYENCVTKGNLAYSFNSNKTGSSMRFVNCTHLSSDRMFSFYTYAASSQAAEIVNCVTLGGGDCLTDSGPTATTITGSNNFGGATNPFPAALQGSPYPITATTSFSTPLGSGDFAVYMGSNGSLADVTGNDVWQQGVGPGTNSDVPTTDINGVARSGASCNPGAFEADGFVAPTVIPKTIGAVGRDYATPILFNADLANIPTSTDLTYHNEAIEGVIDAGEYLYFTVSSALTADATRNLTMKAAVGSEHGGVAGQGVIIYNDTTASGAVFALQEHTTFDGLVTECRVGASGRAGFRDHNAGAMTFRNCMARDLVGTSNIGFYVDRGIESGLVTIENCISRDNLNHFQQVGGTSEQVVLVNCTAIGGLRGVYQSGGTTADWTIINNLFLGATQNFIDTGTGTTVSGSNNFTGTGFTFPAALQGSPYPITASTAYDPGAGDFALYVGKNGALLDSPNNDVINGGVGPASNSNVPTTDILGDTRSGTTTNPGAFEQPQATATITKTIGPSGRDYTTFTLAEADVTNIGGSADLVNENEQIVFEADAGTYDGLIFSYTLTTDPTRNVTFKPAAGSEHGGVRGAGVVLQDNTAVTAYNLQVDGPNNLVLEGLESHTRSGVAARLTLVMNSRGVILRNLILNNEGTQITNLLGGAGWGTSTEPIVYENCVIHSSGKRGFDLENGSGSASYAEIINCTKVDTTDPFVFTGGSSQIDLLLLNNLSLSSSAYTNGGTGTRNITGSNNFGGATNPFPVAIQGSPYPITPTTNTTPGFGDYAIYEPGTGALVVVADNAALGGGVGPAANADVPVLDINGVQRIGGGCDPGAFEGVRSRSTDVWDVMYGSHNIPGTFGNLVQSLPTTIADTVPSAAEIAAAVWAALTSANNISGSFGRMTQQTHLSATRAGSLYQEEQD